MAMTGNDYYNQYIQYFPWDSSSGTGTTNQGTGTGITQLPMMYASADGGGGMGGNAFGYGSQIEPGGSFGSYGTPNYTGGLRGDVQQYGVG